MKALHILLLPILFCLFSSFAFAQYTSTGPFRYYESPEIDGSSTGTTDLGTTVTDTSLNRRFHITGVSVLMTDVGNLLTPATITVGKDASAYNDIVTSTAVGSVVGKVKFFNLAGDLERLDEGTTVKVKVTVAATALFGSPTCKFKVILVGYDRLESD